MVIQRKIHSFRSKSITTQAMTDVIGSCTAPGIAFQLFTLHFLKVGRLGHEEQFVQRADINILDCGPD